jgi:hypothetical protein
MRACKKHPFNDWERTLLSLWNQFSPQRLNGGEGWRGRNSFRRPWNMWNAYCYFSSLVIIAFWRLCGKAAVVSKKCHMHTNICIQTGTCQNVDSFLGMNTLSLDTCSWPDPVAASTHCEQRAFYISPNDGNHIFSSDEIRESWVVWEQPLARGDI